MLRGCALFLIGVALLCMVLYRLRGEVMLPIHGRVFGRGEKIRDESCC